MLPLAYKSGLQCGLRSRPSSDGRTGVLARTDESWPATLQLWSVAEGAITHAIYARGRQLACTAKSSIVCDLPNSSQTADNAVCPCLHSSYRTSVRPRPSKPGEM